MVKKNKSDRRRKSRPSSSGEEASKSWVTFVVVIGFTLSASISILNDQSTARDAVMVMTTNDQQHHRRFLRNEVQVLGGGVEENVWHRQLQSRKGREPEQRDDNDVQTRSMMAAAMVEGGDNIMVDGDSGLPMRRMKVIARYTDKHHFEDCVGKSIEKCQTLVDTFVAADTSLQFKEKTTLMMDIRKIRELTDDSYYKVVLRTNLKGNEVDGIFDDGIIYYPWPWRVKGEDRSIGPWQCRGMGMADCCQMIQRDVSDPDDFGNFLACFVEEPVGSLRNPERDDRVIVIVNGAGAVVRAPIAH